MRIKEQETRLTLHENDDDDDDDDDDDVCVTQCAPRSKHSTSVIKTNLLMLCRAKFFFSEIHTKHTNSM